MRTTDPMRVVVVGASSGLGRCLGVGLAAGGTQVALLARRREVLDEAVDEVGANARAIICDVTNEDSCVDAVREAVGAMGGIDGVVYCPGLGVLSRIEDLDLAAWRRTFDTNVAGASIFTSAALPHLAATNGSAIYLSSISASFTHPWPGLASYTVTKAALDKLVEAWRVEHPEVGFTRLVVGDCAGGEGSAASQFMNGWDMDLLGELFPIWMSRGLLSGRVFDQDELVHIVESVLRCGASAAIPTVTMIPRLADTATSISELDSTTALLDS